MPRPACRPISRPRHCHQPLRHVHQPANKGCDALGRQRRLRVHLAAACSGKGRSIRRLIVVERIGIGYQQRRPADDGDLRDGRGAGARDHQMRRRHACRHVGEEGRDLDCDAKGGIGRLHPRHVIRPGLLGDDQPLALRIRKQRDGPRHGIGEELGALAAAEHQQAERLLAGRRRVRRLGRLQHRRPDRIACRHSLFADGARILRQEATGDGIHTAGQCPVGAPHHRVLLMDQRRHLAPCRRVERRQGRIAAKADDGIRLDPADDGGGLPHAAPDFPEGTKHGDGIFRTHRRRLDRVDGGGREVTGKPLGAVVGCQMHRPAAPVQLVRQRFGREQMSAGSARREKDDAPRHVTPPAWRAAAA